MRKEIWIGLVLVRPQSTNEWIEQGIKGAYVHIAAMASNSEEYITEIKQILNDNDMYLGSVEEIGPYELKHTTRRDNKELRSLFEKAKKVGVPCWGTFHTFREETDSEKVIHRGHRK